MKAVVFHKPGNIRVDTVADPRIEQPGDLFLKVTSTAICGSDLHVYNGFFSQLKPQTIGLEFMIKGCNETVRMYQIIKK